MTPVPRHRAVLLLVCGLSPFVVAPVAAQADLSPQEWLERMSRAVQTSDYEGTVIRNSGSRSETLKVVHAVSDGVIREKLVAQEGDGLEIVRIGNEVQCILPERKSVLVEEWTDQSTLFSTLPRRELRVGSEYDLVLLNEDRIAGRKAVKLAIRPHDEYRYEHRLWLDSATGFPLRTELVAANGVAVDQVKFADIRFSGDIDDRSLKSSYSTDNFKWYTQPRRSATPVAEGNWRNDDLPPGFALVSAVEERVPGTEQVVTHMLYSDGLASVSVFLAQGATEAVTERSTQGASNSFSVLRDDVLITAVGEVPAVTVERMALAMRQD